MELLLSRRTTLKLTTGGALAAVTCFGTASNLPAARAVTDPNLQQTVEADEPIIEGEPVVLNVGHVDMGPRMVDGNWQFVARDDTQHPPVWRRPNDVVLQVTDTAKLEVPQDPAYEFLGAAAGSAVHVIGQTEIPGVVWLGWNTQDPAVIDAVEGGVRLRVHSVEGPGNFALYLQPGNFAPPQILATSDSLQSQPAEVFVELNTHTHANWVFTEPGVYLISIEAAATGKEGTAFSDTATFRFAVGDETSVEAALSADAPETSTSDAAPASDSGGETSTDSGAHSSTESSNSQGGIHPGVIFGGLGVALAGGTAALLAARNKNQKAAEAAFAEDEKV